MNLANDPWIPVVMRNGQHRLVSLVDAFGLGSEIADLSVPVHERIALMRLFLCVSHAGLDGGPVDEADWQRCRSRLGAAAVSYLARPSILAGFEIGGDGQRFLQVTGLSRSDKEFTDALDPRLASGNNTTLFDNAGGNPRIFTDPRVALMLLTFQSFALMKPIGVATWAGAATKRNGAKRHGLCTYGNALHAYLQGASLADTIWLNLPTRQMLAEHRGAHAEVGKPLWEQMPTSFDDKLAVNNATRTYMGRLLPMSRLIRFDPGLQFVMGFSFDYPMFPNFAKEPETTTVTDKTGSKTVLLGGSMQKAIWRSLHAVTVLANRGNGGPLALHHVPQIKDVRLSLWVGAICARPDASIHDMLESVYPLDLSMLEQGGRQTYEQGVEKAERVATKALYAATQEYAKGLRSENHFGGHAARSYWTMLEQNVPWLFAVVEKRTDFMEGGEFAWWRADNPWGRRLVEAAEHAYAFACPRSTPHQLQAYALGLDVLRMQIKTQLGGESVQRKKRKS